MEQPTMAATLARMERDGLVERRPDPDDGRAVLYSLTPAATRKVPAMKAAIERMNADALRALPHNQRDKFRAQLQAVITAMEARIVDEP